VRCHGCWYADRQCGDDGNAAGDSFHVSPPLSDPGPGYPERAGV
jgi:hypothetical protein